MVLGTHLTHSPPHFTKEIPLSIHNFLSIAVFFALPLFFKLKSPVTQSVPVYGCACVLVYQLCAILQIVLHSII